MLGNGKNVRNFRKFDKRYPLATLANFDEHTQKQGGGGGKTHNVVTHSQLYSLKLSYNLKPRLLYLTYPFVSLSSHSDTKLKEKGKLKGTSKGNGIVRVREAKSEAVMSGLFSTGSTVMTRSTGWEGVV